MTTSVRQLHPSFRPAPAPVRPWGAASASRVTVVVVTWDGAHLLPACLDALRAQSVPVEVLVVDNGSTDGTARLLADRYGWVDVLALPTNTGFAGGAQAGLARVRTPFVALLNNDAVAGPRWAEELLGELDRHAGAAAATSRMLLPDGRVNNTGIVLTRWGNGVDRGYGDAPDAWSEGDTVEAVSCGAVLLRTAAVRSVGGLHAGFFLYYEDVDLSLRLRRAGWQLRYAPAATVVHEHGASADLRSADFAYYNLRNHLLCAVRALPGRTCLLAVARFVAVTALDVLRRGNGSALHDPRLRLRVARDVLRGAPAALRARRA